MPRTTERGFTLVELAIVLAIVLIVASIGYTSLALMRPRASLAGASSEIVGLLYNARQNALATGNHTVVMFFPRQANSSSGTGRVVAYEDASLRFFNSASAVNFGNFDATRSTPASGVSLIGDVDLPAGITFGLGGAAVPTLAAPYASVTVSECNFCSTSGDGRGAIVFDSRGSARFFSAADATAAGTPVALVAGTIALTGSPTITGYQLLVVTPATGAVRPYERG